MLNVLLIDSGIDTMHLLKRQMEKKGYKVKYTESNNDVLDIIYVLNILNAFFPRLILLDILQTDVLHQLKTNLHTNRIPVLLMTGYTKKSNGLHSLADDVIEKPFNLSLLEKKIEKLVA